MRASEFIPEAAKYDDATIDGVKAAFDRGDTYEDIAKQFGLSYVNVVQLLAQYYPDRKKKRPSNRRPRMSYDELFEPIKAAWDSGLGAQQISDKLNIPYSLVANILRTRYPDRPRKSAIKTIRVDDLSDDDKADLIARWKDGESVMSLARRFNLPHNNVKPFIISIVGRAEYDRKFKDKVKHLSSKVTNKDRADMSAAYRAGETLEQIGKRYGLTPGSIRYHLLKTGVIQPSTAVPEPDQLKIVGMREQGFSIQKIADELGLPYYTVRDVLIAGGKS